MSKALRSWIGSIVTAVGLSTVTSCSVTPAAKPRSAAGLPVRPNVVIILADDLGFSDLGCYGSEIATPNLDALAKRGLRFTQFYNTARCWPTRAAILTGHYAQSVRRDTVAGVPSGGNGRRPDWATLLPERLKPFGYRSYHSGKWHLDGFALTNGFDRSYRLEDCGRFFSPRVHFLDDQRLPAVATNSGYYATTEIANRTIEFLQEHQNRYRSEPFFAYVCFTAPHFPLHALPEDIAKYRDRYQVGWDAVRAERWQRQRQLGLVNFALSKPDRETGPPYGAAEWFKPFGSGETNRAVAWAGLSDAQREFQSAKMAIHAAMIDRMDQEIGRIVSQLRAMQALDNTLLLFLSDNGASAEIMIRDDGHDPAAPPGSAPSHLCLGPGWSTAANTPLRLHKTWVHEGGISTPLIAHWPAGIAARGELRRTPGHVVDLVPTILELASGNGSNGQAGTVPPFAGQSLVPLLTQADAGVERELWWSHEGNASLRVGDWKLVRLKDQPWELYDLATDRGEAKNLAAQHPEKVRDLAARWERQNELCRKLASEPLPSTNSWPGVRLQNSTTR